jgi:hypothetical protein
VLTNRLAERLSTSRSIARVGAALMLSAVMLTPAFAGSVINLNCIAGSRSFNCVAQMATAGDPNIRVVPELLGDAQKAQTSRDNKWVARCHPVTQRDRYGVVRYHYAAPGCEYGLGTD